MPYHTLQEDAEDGQIEHIESYMQEVGMQKDRCDKTPVLCLHNQIIILGTVVDEYSREGGIVLNVDSIVHDIGENSEQGVGSGEQSYLVGMDAPDSDSDAHDEPC